MSEESEKSEIESKLEELREDIYNINLFLNRAKYRHDTYGFVAGENYERGSLRGVVKIYLDSFMRDKQDEEGAKREEREEREKEIEKTLKIAGRGALLGVLFSAIVMWGVSFL